MLHAFARYMQVNPAEDESLHTLLANGLAAHERTLQDLSDSASREHALEKQLDKMQAEWVRTRAAIDTASDT
jgi:hypothetical protein